MIELLVTKSGKDKNLLIDQPLQLCKQKHDTKKRGLKCIARSETSQPVPEEGPFILEQICYRI